MATPTKPAQTHIETLLAMGAERTERTERIERAERAARTERIERAEMRPSKTPKDKTGLHPLMPG
jgi:hypothetical protein